ncbi:MFS transporter [Streptomyces flavotricini]|uniref:Multidrug efflux pump Tap n=1 Tax=Streptomyces flavotricini TaxID=66888 RepID=A0ABS8E8R5_9ACTN|nr:MFS transporter [Streptomyces flavotricini]MCC0097535.1 MFS transporter [Streptomyces flavotricini]
MTSTSAVLSRAGSGGRARTDFLCLWTAQTFSNLGDALFLSSVAWSATSLFGEGRAAIALGLALFVPTAVLLPLAGVVVDRYRRRTLLVATDSFRAVLTAFLGLVLVTTQASLPLLLCTVVVVQVAGLLFQPSMHSLLGQIANDDDTLLRFDSWMLASRMLATILGPLLAGLVISRGLGAALLLDAGTFCISLIGLFAARRLLGTAAAPRAHERKGLLHEAREGFQVALGDPLFRKLAPTLPVIDLVGASLTLLLPALLLQRGILDPIAYGLLISAWAVGRFAGLLILRVPRVRAWRGVLMAVNCSAQALTVIAIAATPALPWLVVLFVLLGIPSGGASVSVNAYIQTHIPNELRGRVFALLQTTVTAAMPLGPVVAGWLTAWKSPGAALTLMGVLLFAVGVPPLISKRVWQWRSGN